MLRVSFACALLAAGAPAVDATLGKYLIGANKADETADESRPEILDKLDLSKLRPENFRLDRLSPENSAFPELRLDLPPLNGGLEAERFPLPRLGSGFPPEARPAVKVDLHELREQLAHALPQLKPKVHTDSSEETPLLEASVLDADTEGRAFTKGGERLGRLGNIFKQRDPQKIIPSLAMISKKEPNDFEEAGPTETEETTVAAHAGENLLEDEPPTAALSGLGKPLRGLFPESKIKSHKAAGRFNDFIFPDIQSNRVNILKFPKTSRRQDNGEHQTESAHISKKKGLGPKGGFGLADGIPAPVRRLTLLPVLSNALQRIDRRSKKDEESFQAFVRGVKQLQTDVKHDLASTLGTRRRPADLQFVEKLLTKVGLDGLGGPSPLDLSIPERAIMDQARRKRPQVEKIRAKYERDIRYLVNELQSSLRGSNNYAQRISDIINDTMYTGAAVLSV